MSEANSNFRCEKCGVTGEHRRLNEPYAGELWQCRSCGWKTMRDESRSWAKVTSAYSGSSYEKDYEADMRDSNFREVLDHFTLRLVGHDTSGRFSAAENSRIGAILLRHWDKSDEALAIEMKNAGFDLGGMMSSPAKQVADMRKLCEDKYRVKLAGRKKSSVPKAEPDGTRSPTNEKRWWQLWK